MTSTTNWIYSGTNTASGTVVNGYVITEEIPIYEEAIPVILILTAVAIVIWLSIRKRKKLSN